MEKPAFEIVTTEKCTFCAKTKELLTQMGIPFTESHLDTREKIEAFKKNGFKTVPQIFWNQQLIGGYTELLKWFGDKLSESVFWRPISEAPAFKADNGLDVWLGWEPMMKEKTGELSTKWVPRIGSFDVGCKMWVSHFEDHGDPDGHRPIPFDPQPDYFCEGFIPAPPDK